MEKENEVKNRHFTCDYNFIAVERTQNCMKISKRERILNEVLQTRIFLVSGSEREIEMS